MPVIPYLDQPITFAADIFDQSFLEKIFCRSRNLEIFCHNFNVHSTTALNLGGAQMRALFTNYNKAI
jgi:hypothetical protein